MVENVIVTKIRASLSTVLLGSFSPLPFSGSYAPPYANFPSFTHFNDGVLCTLSCQCRVLVLHCKGVARILEKGGQTC